MPKTLDVTFNPKQALAFRYLADRSTTEIMYGGGGGAGKSWLGAFWLWYMMNSYKGLRYAVCRKLINSASCTFSSTFLKVVDYYHDNHRRYHVHKNGILNKATGSEIVYRSLIPLPNDPDYDRLGSLELTGAIIEEAQEVSRDAYQVLTTRLGRQHNKEYGIKQKLLLTCNPGRNFLFTDFYKKKDDPLFNVDKKVVLATSADNLDYLPEEYIQQLNDISDPIIKARILEGSWEFQDLDTSTVIPMSLIVGCIGVPAELGSVRLGIDIGGPATYSDKTIIQPLCGNVIEDAIEIDCKAFKGGGWAYDDWLIEQLITIIDNFGITNMKDVRIDSCGIGQPIYEGLRRRGYSCYPFRGSDKPIPRKFNNNKYNNLRTQSYYELKELFRLRKIKLPGNYNESLIEDLAAVKYQEISGKIACVDKKYTRQSLGRSPDRGDALALAALNLGNSENRNKSDSCSVLISDESSTSFV